jgi:hypothetical protein
MICGRVHEKSAEAAIWIKVVEMADGAPSPKVVTVILPLDVYYAAIARASP